MPAQGQQLEFGEQPKICPDLLENALGLPQSFYLRVGGARSCLISLWLQVLCSRDRERAGGLHGLSRAKPSRACLTSFQNPMWPELSSMISIYPQGRGESVLFLHIREEENESGFDEGNHVSPERPEGVHGVSHDVLGKSSPGRRVRGAGVRG